MMRGFKLRVLWIVNVSLSFLFLLFFGQNLCAQETPKALSFEDCLAEAVKNNPDLSASRESVQKAIYQYRQSIAGFYPQLNLSATTRIGTQTSTGLYSTAPQNQVSLGATLTQNLFNGFTDKTAVEKNYALMRVSELDYTMAKVQLSYDLKNAFTQVVYSRQLVELASEILKQRKLNVDMVRLNFEAGTEHKGSYLLSEAYFHQAVFSQNQAARNLKASLAALAHTMGRNEIIEVSVDGDFQIVPVENNDISKIIPAHPQYLQDQEKINAAKAALMASNGAFFPTLSLNASYSMFDNHFFPQNQSWYFGGTISYPLFSFAQNFYASKMAQMDLEIGKLQTKSLYNLLMADIETSYENATSAINNVSIQNEFLKASEVRAKIARVQYANGLLSFENWDLIENDLITRQQNLLSAKRDAALSEINFEKVSGRSIIP